MPGDIRDRLEEAIRVENERRWNRIRDSHESDREAEKQFRPVRLAAEELREELQSLPSIEFSISPHGVWITLGDRDLRFGYNVRTRHFVGEEAAHSWYDGEAYADRYEWDTAEACIDAMIRLCAKYVRMARAIGAATEQGAP